MRDRLSFFVNGKPVEVGGPDAFLSVSDFLRKRRGLVGTKVVCAEGDCGSCSVLVGKAGGEGPAVYSAVASCIQTVFQLDGCHVVTVEGLKDGGKLNPIQQAIADGNGSQCGFCTPGFVVAGQAIVQNGCADVRRGLVGNLCRCTGYDSIVKAIESVDRSAVKSVAELYPAMNLAAADEVTITAGQRRVYRPVTVEAAIKFRAEIPACTVVSGGTDLGVVVNKKMRAFDVVLSLGGVAELSRCEVETDALLIGAGAALSTLERLALEHIPELGKFLSWFGSPLIKNAGTIGGNLVTGSPIGDTLPALMCLGASVELAGVAGRRWVAVDRFYTGYRKTVMSPDEIVTNVRIPFLPRGELFKLYKVSRRKDLDISTISAAIRIKIVDGVVESSRLFFGGVGPMVLQLVKAEAALLGASSLEDFEAAGRVAREEVTPINDVRGSAEYRRVVAGNLVVKFWHEMVGRNDQVPKSQSNPNDQCPNSKGR